MLVGMFAGYSVAKELLTTAPLFAPKTITDGKAERVRFDDPFQAQRDGVLSGYADLRNRIATMLLTLVPTAAVTAVPTRVYISSTGIAPDPITGV
jgi:hypothetical protein